MQAIVLAAGMGSRLKDITKEKPKALVPINENETLLHRTLNLLENMGVSRVVIVVGYKKEVIIDTFSEQYGQIKIDYVSNDQYSTTNNIYSLYLTKDHVHEDTLLLECDLIVHPNALNTINTTDAACCIVTSPYNPTTMDGSVIVANENKIESLVLKSEQTADFNYRDAYKTVNIYRFSHDFFSNKFIPAIERKMEISGVNNYYESALKELIVEAPEDFSMLKISEDLWYEIDDQTDLKRAKDGIAKWEIL